MELTDDQRAAFDTIMDWLGSASGKSTLTLGGYAGTGKTTLIGHIIKHLHYKNDNYRIALCCPSGKAAENLSRRVTMHSDDYIGTIHGLLYSLVSIDDSNPRPELIFSLSGLRGEYDLIIIDEASMVSSTLWDGILSVGIPVLAVGDHGQLPPVNSTFNLMQNPDIRLENIMRQAQGDPIIQFSMMARNGDELPYGYFGSVIRVRTYDWNQYQFDSRDNIILCATNATRLRYNNYARARLGFVENDLPRVGEPIICLMNDKGKGLFNGSIGVIDRVSYMGDIIDASVIMNSDYTAEVSMWRDQFMQKYTLNSSEMPDDVNQFDYAYCITTHKSQGSEFDKVVIISQRMPWMSDDEVNRWNYTAITRAKKELIIVG